MIWVLLLHLHHQETNNLKSFLAQKLDLSKEVGKLIAKKAMDAGIKKIGFDRNGYLYHGHIKSLAEGAREQGLNF